MANSLITMFDSDLDSQFPRGGQAYAAYVDGRVADQPNFQWVVQEFPNAYHLSITVFADRDADCLDIESGAASVSDVPGWYARQRARGVVRPCLYASADLMQSGIVPLVRSGKIARPLVRLWSAHYAGRHVCAPLTCGLVSIAMDGTQWTDMAFGRNLDESLVAADFFGSAPKPAPSPVPAWQEAMMNALPVVKQGDTGEAVRTVQGLCIARGHQVAVDGDFGPATHEAVTAVQSAAHVASDGVVGQATWPVLAGV